MSLELKITSSLENFTESADGLTVSIPDNTGVYNITTNPTGYGASQTPANKREIADIIQSRMYITDTEDVTSTISLDSTDAQSLANGTALDITTVDLGETSSSEFSDGIYNGKYEVDFSDFTLSSTVSGISTSTSISGSATLPSGTYDVYISARDGNGNFASYSTGNQVVVVFNTNGIQASWTQVTNAVSYRVFISSGSNKYYYDVTTNSATILLVTTNTWTSLPSSNATQSYVNLSGSTFTIQGISPNTLSANDLAVGSLVNIAGTVYTIATTPTTTSFTVSEDITDLTTGYNLFYSTYRTTFSFLLTYNVEKCAVINSPKAFEKVCCDDCSDTTLLGIMKIISGITAAKSAYIEENYTGAQEIIDYLVSVCDGGDLCTTC
jgi:hypothetical protein